MEAENTLTEDSGIFSISAEAAVLGSLILAPSLISRILPILPDDKAFFIPEHQMVYSALVSMFVANSKIDPVLLRAELESRRELDKLGGTDCSGVEYIGKLLDSVPSSANAVYYARIVRDRQQYRKLVSTVELIDQAVKESTTTTEKIQAIQELALNLEPVSKGHDYIEAKNRIISVVENLQKHADTIPSGFRNIDRIINGFGPGEFAILAGRPSMGKSALMLDIALKIATTGIGVLIFTLEMTEDALLERALCSVADCSLAAAKGDILNQGGWDKIYAATNEIEKLPIILCNTADTPEKQIALTRRLKKTHNIGIVFVDYLQLMHAGRKSESRQQEITTISRKLKRLAITEQLPVIALSQLNRQVESRENHRPRMSDLRESGSLEQDADLVLFISREDYYRRNTDPQATSDGVTDIIIAKNRRGPTGTAKLVFLEDSVSFGDLN